MEAKALKNMVRPARLERATCGFEVRRSIQLSYGRWRYPTIEPVCFQCSWQRRLESVPTAPDDKQGNAVVM